MVYRSLFPKPQFVTDKVELIPRCGTLRLLLLHFSWSQLYKALQLFWYDSLMPHSVNSASHLCVTNCLDKIFCLEVYDLYFNYSVFLKFLICYNHLLFFQRAMEVFREIQKPPGCGPQQPCLRRFVLPPKMTSRNPFNLTYSFFFFSILFNF